MRTSTTELRLDDVPSLARWRRGNNRFTHDWFRFPGKFHPPLIAHILRSLRPIAVADPMAGVGTVAVEAKAAGIPSLSLDVDPLSAFFAEVKTTPISNRTLRAAWKDLAESLKAYRRDNHEILRRRFRDVRIDHMRSALRAFRAQQLERLVHWFRRYVLVDYARIDHFIWNGGLPNRSHAVRRFFLACLLSSVRRISLADPTPVSGLEVTSHMKKRIKRGYVIDVFGEFERRVDLAIDAMNQYTTYLQEKGTYNTPAIVGQADAAVLRSKVSEYELTPDLILFSPPYCNAIEYWRRHRLEYFLGHFLDENGVAELHHESVGRTTVGRTAKSTALVDFEPVDRILRDLINEERSKKARLLGQYFADMKTRIAVCFDSLRSNGYCIIIVGDSTTGGRRIPTARTLCWLAEQVGFEHARSHRYLIKNRVMQFPLKSNDRIEHESIIMLRRP